MNLLYVNACVRPQSRTKALADYLISRINPGKVTKLNLADMNLKPLSNADLERRTRLMSEQVYDDDMFASARTFAAADVIVIAAPFWDLSFPSSLKVFIEHVNVNKIVFQYSAVGKIEPLCRAKKLYYVTTKGGYLSDDYGFKYVEALCRNLYGIEDITLIKAEGLDVKGNDVESLLNEAKQKIDALTMPHEK